MPTLLIESAIRATLVAAAVSVVLFVMRIRVASVLHAVWAGVVVLMLLLPAWVAWGPRASLPVLPSQVRQTTTAIGTVRSNRLTSASCVVPVTVGLSHPRIILPECSHEWPQAQLDAVLAHEGEHIRRRDPLFQWIALLNRALFWFHPLAWWLERKISGLAEEACDVAVLARGYHPREYAEYLLDLA